VLTSTGQAGQERQLEPRYRRILSFGDVLDESIGLYRGHWATFALVSAICLLPPGVIQLMVTAGGVLDTRGLVGELATGDPQATINFYSRIAGPLLLLTFVAVFFALAWTAAVVVCTDTYLHGAQPELSAVAAHVLRRYVAVLLTGFCTLVGLVLITLAAGLLVAISVVLLPILVLETFAAIVGLCIWWFRPSARTTWLKWLIIVATPMGLMLYFFGTWSMAIIAVVLEPVGPLRALRRSMQLVDRHWFRTIGILVVAGLIVTLLQDVPALLVQLPLTVLAFARGQTGLGPTEQAISVGAQIVTEVLFASMSSIVYAMLFIDLRNRRDATDIAERVTQLEANA